MIDPITSSWQCMDLTFLIRGGTTELTLKVGPEADLIPIIGNATIGRPHALFIINDGYLYCNTELGDADVVINSVALRIAPAITVLLGGDASVPPGEVESGEIASEVFQSFSDLIDGRIRWM